MRSLTLRNMHEEHTNRKHISRIGHEQISPCAKLTYECGGHVEATHIVVLGGVTPFPSMYYYGGVLGPARRGTLGGYPPPSTYYRGRPFPTQQKVCCCCWGRNPPSGNYKAIQYESENDTPVHARQAQPNPKHPTFRDIDG